MRVGQPAPSTPGMFSTGVASFGHVGGVHVQNVDTWEQYVERLDRGELPLDRALW